MRVSFAAACALAAVAFPAAAFAAGSLSLSSSATPTASVTLSGADQTTSYTIPSSVSDGNNGINAVGWNITITSTTFTTGTYSLAANASTIDAAPAFVCQPPPACVDPVNNVAYPVAVPSGATAPA